MKSQAYDLDQMAITRFGIPSKNLMGEAGRNVSKFIKDNIKFSLKPVGAQGRASAGTENEDVLENEVKKYLAEGAKNIIFKGTNQDYTTKNIKEIKPTLKRYLAGRVKTRYRRVDADEFTVATLLPVARWKKGSQSTVYSDSRKMI